MNKRVITMQKGVIVEDSEEPYSSILESTGGYQDED